MPKRKRQRRMRISFNTNPGNLNLNTGYGVAGYNVVTSLQRLGHEVNFKDSGAPVEIAMCMPDFSEWSSKDAYHIQYTPWESTELKDGWLEAFNNNCDEVWTTSPLIKYWYKQAGVTKPLYVYQHGISHEYTAQRRVRNDVLRILHIGEPASRKGGQMAFDAFRDVFGNRKDVHLTIKAWNRSNIREYDARGSIIGLPHELYSNVTTVYNDYSTAEMINLMHKHHALVYPSWGEGFGFIPLEAMATGLPTIVPGSWAPYERFILPELRMDSSLVDSPFGFEHPGKMFKPDYDSLVTSYKRLDEDYHRLAGVAYRNSFKIHEEYDWDTLTANAWDRIVKKLS
jgi:glycosyltransferase involved in cell wall biosynthesis